MQRPEPPWRRLLPTWIFIIAGVGLSVAAYFLARRQEALNAETDFSWQADAHYSALKASLNRHLDSLHNVQKLMQLSSNVGPSEFQEWARDIVASHPEIQVIHWCPRVPKAERAAHEARMRQGGQVDYFISERNVQGQCIPAAERDEYFPVLFFQPVRGNEGILGFDAGAGQSAQELVTARDTGQPAVSGRIHIVRDAGDRAGVIVTFPVYRSGAALDTLEQRRRAFTGCVRGVFRLRDLLTAAWGNDPMSGMQSLILDASAPDPTNRFILFYDSPALNRRPDIPSETEFRAGTHHEAAMRLGLRTWTFLFRPTAEWWSTQFTWLPHFILAGGLCATMLATAHVRGSMRRTEIIEDTVRKRTVELNREVAERRRTEDELRKIQTTLVLAQRVGQVGSWEADLVNGTLSWSEETFRLFGQNPESFVPTTDAFYASVHPDDQPHVKRAAQAAITSGMRYQVEHRIQRPDGSERFVHEIAEIVCDSEGKAVRMIGTVQDITDRHHAEEQLERERNLLRTVIDHLPDHIFFKDAEGRLVLCNLANQRCLGAERMEDLLGKTDADFLPAEVAMLYMADDRRVLETGEAIIGREEPLLTRDGQRRHLLTTKIPLHDSRGQITGLVGVCHDITERKRAEDERQLMDRKFQETQKLESLGVLAGGIAHDFNNLLTGILGHACLGRMELPPESPLQSHLEQIELASHRAADLCKQMLAYSGKGRFVIQPIHLSALVNETLHLLQVSISKRAVLKLALEPDLPAIMADATQLRQIIMNLVMNASEAMGDGSGLITVSTHTRQADRKYLSDLAGAQDLTPGNYVVLEIADNGCGMSPEVKARIFEPFFTTKFTGRGLGLAAVLGIVQGHRGALKVESQAGCGSTFTLLLPAAGPPTGETNLVRRKVQPWRGTGTVLVIDDEAGVRMVATRMLKALGFEVLTASDGEQGLEIYRANADRVDAVLLDLTMPRTGGEETFHAIRSVRADACVVLMSGFSEQEAAARFIGTGLAGFVQKPFSPEQLGECLKEFIGAQPAA